MKNKQLTQSDQRSKTMSVFLMMFMAFILTSFAGFAQQVAPVTADKAKVDNAAIQPSTHNVTLGQLAEMHPKDEYLARASHMQKVVDNPSAYPQFTQENIEEYKARIAMINLDLDQYNKAISSGQSADVAYSQMVSSRGNQK